ncbi:MAG: hypothetical protein J6Y35_00360 [Bacteroidales bacterium]|nr:hypothetical protein [Bacteroidales bacterium]
MLVAPVPGWHHTAPSLPPYLRLSHHTTLRWCVTILRYACVSTTLRAIALVWC